MGVIWVSHFSYIFIILCMWNTFMRFQRYHCMYTMTIIPLHDNTPTTLTHPQDGAWISTIPNLLRIVWSHALATPLVNTSANCWSVVANDVHISPPSSFSQTKCRFTSMCLVRSCYTGLWEILMAALLSQYRLVSNPISQSRVLNQRTSQTPCTIVRYSASALDLATTDCFLLCYVTRFPPINEQ